MGIAARQETPMRVVRVVNIKPLKKPETFVELAARLRTVTKVEFIMIGRPGAAKNQRRLEAQIRNVPGLTYLGEKSNEKINRLLVESHMSRIIPGPLRYVLSIYLCNIARAIETRFRVIKSAP
jgi:hypothetical protein